MSLGPTSIAAFVAFIGVLIFVHELGHFLAAKYFDIKVLKFSLGFGPPLVAFTRKDTTYQIAAVPLGGYVKMLGDGPPEEGAETGRALNAAPIHQRAIIYAAGPLFNLVLPVVCFFAYSVLGPMVHSPVLGQIEIGQPADRAGLRPGDRIVSVDGERTWSFQRFHQLISARPGKESRLAVLRDGQQLELTVTPDPVRVEGLFGNDLVVGRVVATSARTGSRVGVDDSLRPRGSFVTGDRVLSVDERMTPTLDELESAFRQSAGRTVRVRLARSAPLSAGDVLFADAVETKEFDVEVPGGFQTIESLGLASSETFVRVVVRQGAAERAGIKPGDRVLRVEGQPIRLFWSVLRALQRAEGAAVPVTVLRGGRELELLLGSDPVRCVQEVTKKETTVFDPGFGFGVLPEGASCYAYAERNQALSHWASGARISTERAHLSVAEALVWSVLATKEVVSLVGTGIYKLVTGQISRDNVGGVGQVFKLAAEAADLGFGVYLERLAIVSVNLALINLLPIPIFDGGHLMFCAIEGIRRRPLSARAREFASLVGLLVLFALLALAIHNDIRSFGVF